jgi:hypothetical protein
MESFRDTPGVEVMDTCGGSDLVQCVVGLLEPLLPEGVSLAWGGDGLGLTGRDGSFEWQRLALPDRLEASEAVEVAIEVLSIVQGFVVDEERRGWPCVSSGEGPSGLLSPLAEIVGERLYLAYGESVAGGPTVGVGWCALSGVA